MTPRHSFLLNAAKNLGLPVEGAQHSLLTNDEIAARLGQNLPYLAVTDALLWRSDSGNEILAEVIFGAAACAGHYPGSPSIPLVDMGRAMDQTAAISLNGHSGIPLLKRIGKLRAESMEVARPDRPYWVSARREKGELVTRLYSSASGKMLASIQGWEYDFAPAPTTSRTPQFANATEPATHAGVEWEDSISYEQIVAKIPQTPPFLVLRSGCRGRSASGADVVQTTSRFGADHVAGHLGGVSLLGPMHYSRSLAQSGMLLASLVGNIGKAVPEVVSAKTIWYDTREYFGPDWEVVTTVTCDRSFTRGGHSFVSLNGVVCVQGKPVLGTESFNYVLVPSAQHPAMSSEHA